MYFTKDDLDAADVAALLADHLDDMADHSPPESVHALDLGALRGPGVVFWTARADGEVGTQKGDLLGCGALREIDPLHGEVKSMKTARAHLRKGIAAKILHHILDEARDREYVRVSLETGAADAFNPARALYGRFGFSECGPFEGYDPDRHSVFMTREV
jgi:putative acetyltransferase